MPAQRPTVLPEPLQVSQHEDASIANVPSPGIELTKSEEPQNPETISQEIKNETEPVQVPDNLQTRAPLWRAVLAGLVGMFNRLKNRPADLLSDAKDTDVSETQGESGLPVISNARDFNPQPIEEVEAAVTSEGIFKEIGAAIKETAGIVEPHL